MSNLIVSPSGSSRSSKHAHHLVHKTAVEMAHELYDEIMKRNNDWYKRWVALNPGIGAKGLEDRFVAKMIPDLIPKARATLANMLSMPIAEALKDEIFEALCLDATLLRGRGGA